MKKPTSSIITVNTHEAKTTLSKLLLLVEGKGVTVRICRNGKPVADLQPVVVVKDPLEQNPKLAAVTFKEDPILPLDKQDWPTSLR